MHQFTMSIEGKQYQGSDSFGVINPATEEVFAQAPKCSEEELERAVQAADSAFKPWKRDEKGRRQALKDCAEIVQSRAEDLARLLTMEQGKPLRQARTEIDLAITRIKTFADMRIPHDEIQDDDRAKIEICYRPFGVVAGITPWNFPIQTAVAKIVPPILVGNTVVLKPSPYTPLSTLKLGELMNRVLPAGVLNVISGDDDLGAMLAAHAKVRKISLTGSIPTGKKVAQTAALDLKRVTLELGGNDPAIILDDAEVSSIVARIFWSAFLNCGQVCLAVKRVYVAEKLFSPFVEAISKFAREVKVGDGLEPENKIGPINNLMQFERVSMLVEDAKKNGAKIHSGGARLNRKGYFFMPTIVTEVGDDVAVVAEEQFGPVLPVLSFNDIHDAVERANTTNYGLGGSVWSSNPERAYEVAQKIDAGTVWVNQHTALTPKAPFGGAKWSGIGLSSGRWSLESFLQKHVININRS